MLLLLLGDFPFTMTIFIESSRSESELAGCLLSRQLELGMALQRRPRSASGQLASRTDEQVGEELQLLALNTVSWQRHVLLDDDDTDDREDRSLPEVDSQQLREDDEWLEEALDGFVLRFLLLA